MDETGVVIEGLEETAKSINDLLGKLKEAKSIAEELASTHIILNDKRQKDIMVFIDELRDDFFKKTGREPAEFLLVAKDNSFEFQIRLNI